MTSVLWLPGIRVTSLFHSKYCLISNVCPAEGSKELNHHLKSIFVDDTWTRLSCELTSLL